MPRSSALPAVALLLLLFGCAKQQESVYVDLNSALSAPQPVASAETGIAAPAPAVGMQAAAQPPLPGRALMDRADTRIADARKLIEDDRQQALKTLTRRLAAIYANEIDQDSQERIDAMRTAGEATLKQAYDEVSRKFQSYADARGPLATRLTLVASPAYLRGELGPLAPDHPIAIKRAQQVQTLTEQIKRLDDDFAKDSHAILAAAQATIDHSLAEFNAQLAEKKGLAQDRATQDAGRQIRAARAGLMRGIRTETSAAAPSELGHEVVMQASPPLKGVPAASPLSLGRTEEERRALVEQELEIWLRTKGYQRSATRAGARDATEEFMQWRAQHKAGP